MILEEYGEGWQLENATLPLSEKPIFRFVVAETNDTHDASIHAITSYSQGRCLDLHHATVYSRISTWWGITGKGFLSWGG